MGVQVQNSPNPKKCLVCQQSLGFLRRLAKRHFCSEKHEKQYLAELGEIAIVRLQTARTRVRRVSA